MKIVCGFFCVLFFLLVTASVGCVGDFLSDLLDVEECDTRTYNVQIDGESRQVRISECGDESGEGLPGWQFAGNPAEGESVLACTEGLVCQIAQYDEQEDGWYDIGDDAWIDSPDMWHSGFIYVVEE